MYFWLLCLYVVFVLVKCIWYLIDVTSNNCHIETFTSYEPFFVVLWEFHGYSLTDVSKMKFDWSILKCSIVIVLQYYLVHSLKMKRDWFNFLLLKKNSYLKSSILHYVWHLRFFVFTTRYITFRYNLIKLYTFCISIWVFI